jgi:hypothetical protein
MCVLDAIYEACEMEQAPVMKSYVEYWTKEREKAEKIIKEYHEGTEEHEAAVSMKKICKLMVNCCFGKTMQDVTKFNTSELVRTQLEYHRKTIGKNFSSTVISKNLIELKMQKTSVTIKTPLYLASVILASSKMLMLDFIYNCLFKVYDPKDIQLCYSDTDCIYFKVKNLTPEKNIQKRYQQFEEKFQGPLRDLFFQTEGHLTPGKMALEKLSLESVWLKPKCYAHRQLDLQALPQIDIEMTGKVKGVKMNQNPHLRSFDKYREALFDEKIQMAKNTNIKKSTKFGKPAMYTLEQTKIGYDSWDNKRLWVTKVDSTPYGFSEMKENDRSSRSIEQRFVSNLYHRIQDKVLTLDFHTFMKYLGCTPKQLMDHIEKQLPKVDTPACWENYGKLWELDHIIPVSVIEKIQKPTSELLEAFAKEICRFSNIQPLSKSQNCTKRDKLCELAMKTLKETNLLKELQGIKVH